jgi:hypothetical protein
MSRLFLGSFWGSFFEPRTIMYALFPGGDSNEFHRTRMAADVFPEHLMLTGEHIFHHPFHVFVNALLAVNIYPRPGGGVQAWADFGPEHRFVQSLTAGQDQFHRNRRFLTAFHYFSLFWISMQSLQVAGSAVRSELVTNICLSQRVSTSSSGPTVLMTCTLVVYPFEPTFLTKVGSFSLTVMLSSPG